MKKVLIYCPHIAGHRLEYINHLYKGACDRKRNAFIFAVEKNFHNCKSIMDWPQSENIDIVTIEDDIIKKSKGNILRQAYYKCKGLGTYTKRYNPDEVIVLDMIEYVPFLPLFVSVPVKGIIYRVITYEWKTESIFRRAVDYLKYWTMAHFNSFQSVYMLNDKQSVNILNEKYHTSCFKYLPDPVVPITRVESIDIRAKYNISPTKTILLHPGGMLRYKGTLEILKAINIMSDEVLSNYVFIFAGRITDSIKKEFKELIDIIGDRANIIIEDGFFPFEVLGAFIKNTDWILIPYKTKSQSSGILGHAAYFQKPVIGVRDSLIGNIIEEYNLGVCIEKSNAESIKMNLEHLPKLTIKESGYVESHSIDMFNDHILG